MRSIDEKWVSNIFDYYAFLLLLQKKKEKEKRYVLRTVYYMYIV